MKEIMCIFQSVTGSQRNFSTEKNPYIFNDFFFLRASQVPDVLLRLCELGTVRLPLTETQNNSGLNE